MEELGVYRAQNMSLKRQENIYTRQEPEYEFQGTMTKPYNLKTLLSMYQKCYAFWGGVGTLIKSGRGQVLSVVRQYLHNFPPLQ